VGEVTHEVTILKTERVFGTFRGAVIVDGRPRFFAFKEGHAYPDLDEEGRAILTALAAKALLNE
jgi:hypothetical protein